MATKAPKKTLAWSETARLDLALKASADGRMARVRVHSGKKAEWKGVLPAPSESQQRLLLRQLETSDELKILVSPLAPSPIETDPRLKESNYARVRDAMGSVVACLERADVQVAQIDFDLNADDVLAAIVGLEMALYRYKRMVSGDLGRLALRLTHKGKPLLANRLREGMFLGQAVNLARHLVNLPPNLLNPETYARFVQELKPVLKHAQVAVWDSSRLKKENMGLHLSVGEGSATAPCLVHIRYRPPGSGRQAPVAFVGKGITFDSGGLDIKPSSGMRLMKKDMGGSAAVMGLAYWMAKSGHRTPADFYLALAENSISGASFRPSDVLRARNGMSVEIHNTDAEGRLVLADAMNVAVTAKEKPRLMIDVATLTGAIKTALGAGVAGLFANESRLSQALAQAAQGAGDPVWTMPLVQKYRPLLNSAFADMINSSDGFGGAVTAALFLEKFAGGIPWAHLDIYAWKDGADGACLESGGSGQTVQLLAQFLDHLPRSL